MRLSIFYAATTFTFSILAFSIFVRLSANELNCYESTKAMPDRNK